MACSMRSPSIVPMQAYLGPPRSGHGLETFKVRGRHLASEVDLAR